MAQQKPTQNYQYSNQYNSSPYQQQPQPNPLAQLGSLLGEAYGTYSLGSDVASLFGGAEAAAPVAQSSMFGPAGAIGQNIDGTFMMGSAASEAAPAATEAAATEAGMMSELGPYALLAAAAYATGRGVGEVYDTYRTGHGEQQNAAMQAANPFTTGVNSMLGAPLNNEDAGYLAMVTNPFTTAVGTPLAAYHYLGSEMLGLPDVPNFWSGKGKDQRGRDSLRSALQDRGIIGEDYMYNGFNIGSGGTKLTNSDGTQRNDYDSDMSLSGLHNGGAANQFDQENAAIQAIAAAMGVRGKQASDFTGMMSNATRNQGDSRRNVQDLGSKFGGHDQLYGQIHAMSESGELDKGEADIYKNALDQAYGVGAYAKGGRAESESRANSGDKDYLLKKIQSMKR